MKPPEEALTGTLRTDGTLELDAKPNLPPGRVRVVLQAVGEPEQQEENWWDYMQRTRRELEAMNYPTMTTAEVESYVEWLRGDDDRIEEAYRQAEEERRRREQGPC